MFIVTPDPAQKNFSYSEADSSQLSAQAITDHTLRRYLTNINYFFCLIRKLI